MIRHSLIAGVVLVAITHTTLPAAPKPSRAGSISRLQAAPHQLQLVIDAAGRDGFTCVSVARPEIDVKLPGVVVTLARPYIEMTL